MRNKPTLPLQLPIGMTGKNKGKVYEESYPPASRPHDVAVVDMLKADPAFADVYLAAALEEAAQPGGQQALLAVLRQVAEAQGMTAVACNA